MSRVLVNSLMYVTREDRESYGTKLYGLALVNCMCKLTEH